jgi:hypothetical protein
LRLAPSANPSIEINWINPPTPRAELHHRQRVLWIRYEAAHLTIAHAELLGNGSQREQSEIHAPLLRADRWNAFLTAVPILEPAIAVLANGLVSSRWFVIAPATFRRISDTSARPNAAPRQRNP